MSDNKFKGARFAAWFAYFMIVFEIIYMISPFAFYFYSFYGVPLDLLSSNRYTHWLTSFMLPHYAENTSALSVSVFSTMANVLGYPLIFIGLVFFLIGFTQIYYSKFAKKGAVVGGLYNYIRHPQYTALAVLGLGALAVWPRFIVLLMYVTMIFLYYFLAKIEENECRTKFGKSYEEYLSKTGMFFPLFIEKKFTIMPRILPEKGPGRVLSLVALYVILIGTATGAGLLVRENTVESITTIFKDRIVVISLPLMEKGRLEKIYSDFSKDLSFQNEAKDGFHICYVVPLTWSVPELPSASGERVSEHSMPKKFGDDFRVIVMKTKVHDPDARGKDILFSAYKTEPIMIYTVKNETAAKEEGFSKAKWNMIPVPLY